MAVNRYTRPRTRPAPRSQMSREHLITRILADIHDRWIALRYRRYAQQELTMLDDQMLKDIGVTRATIDDVIAGKTVRHASLCRTVQTKGSETTFPPYCERDVAQVAPNIEGLTGSIPHQRFWTSLRRFDPIPFRSKPIKAPKDRRHPPQSAVFFIETGRALALGSRVQCAWGNGTSSRAGTDHT